MKNRRSSLLLKWRYLRFGIFMPSIIAIIITSCRKDNNITDNQLTNYVDAGNLKLWFAQNGISIKNKDNWLNTLDPNWGKVQRFDGELENIYEIDLNNPDKIFSAGSEVDVKNIRTFENRSLLKLIIFENKLTNKYNAAIIELVAFDNNTTPLEELHYKSYGSFTGAVNFYEFSGELSNGWLYEKGKIVAKSENPTQIKIGKSSIKAKGKIMLADLNSIECGSRSVPHWRENCITVGGIEGWGYDGSGGSTNCSWEVYHTTEIIYCPSGDSGGGDGGGYSGGSGGSGTSTPPNDPPADDPCAKKIKIKAVATNSKVAAQNAEIKNKTTSAEGSKEYGAEQNLVSPTATSDYKPVTVRTDELTGVLKPNFTWNANNGYTIGISHGHPGSSAPSPDDVFWMIDNLVNSQELIAASSAEKNFYKQNVSVTVITPNGTKYVVSVKDWSALGASFATYNQDRDAYRASFQGIAAQNNSTEYALLNKLGNAVNLFKAEPNGNEFKPILISSDNNKVVPNPCPGEAVE